jgi:GT2 family glycosyltransferase
MVLVTFNGWQHTSNCLARLFSQTFSVPFEIIVVDNASSDGSARKIREHFPAVRLIESQHNVGFGAACNLGLKQATGNFYVLLNNDALIDAEQLDQLLQTYQRLGLNGIYTARIVDGNGVEEASCFREITPIDLFLDTFMLMSSALRRHTYSLESCDHEALEIEACSGAFCLFPQTLWQHTGGFDERFFMYYEDMDLCRRSRALGYGVYVNTRVTLFHEGGGSALGNVWRASTVDHSQRLFYRKHYGTYGIVITRMHQFLRSAPRALVHGLLSFSPRQREMRRMHARLALDAISGGLT